jgi:hypothetical protein
MATVGEKREKIQQTLRQQKLKDASAYWKYLEEEGRHCLRDI